MVVYSIPHPYIFVQPVRHEKRGIAILLIALFMLHCPVTVVQRYRDGVCGLLFHLFFIICHPYTTLRLLYTKPDLLVQLSLSEYSPSLGESLFRTRAPNEQCRSRSAKTAHFHPTTNRVLCKVTRPGTDISTCVLSQLPTLLYRLHK